MNARNRLGFITYLPRGGRRCFTRGASLAPVPPRFMSDVSRTHNGDGWELTGRAVRSSGSNFCAS